MLTCDQQQCNANVTSRIASVGLPNSSQNDGALSDVGRALQLKSGWYVPVGVSDPASGGGGIHWFRADDDRMTHLVEKSYLFNSSRPDPSFECPDVFELGGKVVVLASEPGAVNTEGTSHWWVGTLSDDELHFAPETSGRFDYGLPGFSSMYAAKSGTNAFAPFSRRVLFGFSGWRSEEIATCGKRYLLPRELSISANNTLLQHPAAELAGLRQGPRVQGPTAIAAGAQVEVLVQCTLPLDGGGGGGLLPTKGVLGVNTLLNSGSAGGSSQSVQVGYDFANLSGFATVSASLDNGQGGRTDRAPLAALRQRYQRHRDHQQPHRDQRQEKMSVDSESTSTLDLHVFVDGQIIETFFNGEATITTAANNLLATELVSSSFVNTANLNCNVSSWILGLSAPPPVNKPHTAHFTAKRDNGVRALAGAGEMHRRAIDVLQPASSPLEIAAFVCFVYVSIRY